MEKKLRKIINIVDPTTDFFIDVIKQKNKLKNFIDKQIKERDYVWATIGAYVGYGVLEGVESLVDASLEKKDYANATCTAFNEYGKKGVKKLAETLIEEKDYVGALVLYEYINMRGEYERVLNKMNLLDKRGIQKRHRLFLEEYLKDRKYVKNTLVRAVEILQL